jgi:hypothetical protein
MNKVAAMCAGRAMTQIHDEIEDEPNLKLVVERLNSITPHAYFTPDGFQINDDDIVQDLFRAEIGSPQGIVVRVEVNLDMSLRDYSVEGSMHKYESGMRHFKWRGVLFPEEEAGLQGTIAWQSCQRGSRKRYPVLALRSIADDDTHPIRLDLGGRQGMRRQTIPLGRGEVDKFKAAIEGYLAAKKFVKDCEKGVGGREGYVSLKACEANRTLARRGI